MSEQKWTPDWTPEPWHDDKGYRIYGWDKAKDPHGLDAKLLCEFKHFDGQPGDSARAVACVNALAGVADPAVFVALVRDAVEAGAIDEVYLSLIRSAMNGGQQ